jgi:hypothetical protein
MAAFLRFFAKEVTANICPFELIVMWHFAHVVF